MAKVIDGEERGRPRRWLVDYYDGTGKRRVRTFKTRRLADDFLAQAIPESRQAAEAPQVDPDIRVAPYVDRFLREAAPRLKPKSRENYAICLRRHVLPVLGRRKVRQLRRGEIRALLAAKLEQGLVRGSVAAIYTAVRAMLSWAVDEDHLLTANPAARLGRTLNLLASKATRQASIKAMTAEQLGVFLEGARTSPKPHERRQYPLFLHLARTGERVGEARAQQWQDVDFEGRTIRVERAYSDDRLDTPKSGHGRTIEMSPQLAAVLRRLEIERKAETLRRGWAEVPRQVFCTPGGTPVPQRTIARAFAGVLKRAGLPQHFTPHSLRHTFASLLLQRGESPQYVQEQLGHASITLTVDTYGRWLPKQPIRGGVAGLDESPTQRVGSKPVAEPVATASQAQENVSELPEKMEIGNGTTVKRRPLIA